MRFLLGLFEFVVANSCPYMPADPVPEHVVLQGSSLSFFFFLLVGFGFTFLLPNGLGWAGHELVRLELLPVILPTNPTRPN